ncbi:MAG: hypothetical protein IJH55_10100, partial [Romboutsia sp.]|nr:hypothetical protein [Romboutsia sp.]
ALSMHVYEKDFDIVNKIAYGDMRIKDERLDIYKLIKIPTLIDELIDIVDNKWVSKEDFNTVLRLKGVIR